jgi:hypothetical protein
MPRRLYHYCTKTRQQQYVTTIKVSLKIVGSKLFKIDNIFLVIVNLDKLAVVSHCIQRFCDMKLDE